MRLSKISKKMTTEEIKEKAKRLISGEEEVDMTAEERDKLWEWMSEKLANESKENADGPDPHAIAKHRATAKRAAQEA